jgi:hypothetical protein
MHLCSFSNLSAMAASSFERPLFSRSNLVLYTVIGFWNVWNDLDLEPAKRRFLELWIGAVCNCVVCEPTNVLLFTSLILGEFIECNFTKYILNIFKIFALMLGKTLFL